MEKGKVPSRLSFEALLELKRWNTPSVYNGWEAITKKNRAKGHFNLEETRDYMPQMGPMVGYAVTVVIEPSNPRHPQVNPNVWSEYRRYVAGVPGPKIVVVQDLDKPEFVGAYWGEVNSNTHRALGCVGTIIDGVIRDVDEMCNAGFKAIAKRTSIGHAYSVPVRWNCDVEVFGCPVRPGQLIHADKHGFLVVPDEDEAALARRLPFHGRQRVPHADPGGPGDGGQEHGRDPAGYGRGRAAVRRRGARTVRSQGGVVSVDAGLFLQIADQVRGKTTLWPEGYAAEAVAKGDVELCIHQISEILAVKGVTLAGPLPRELQKVSVYSAGVAARASAPDAAKMFLAFLQTPSSRAKFTQVGLDYAE